MGTNKDLVYQLRHDFSQQKLSRKDAAALPHLQFEKWFAEAVEAEVLEVNAMTVATVGPEGFPATRIVLLREFDATGYAFYTNYNSWKGSEMAHSNKVEMHFFWPEIERQIRIRGTVTRCSAEKSDAYFASRPRGSQIGAWASEQSATIEGRHTIEDAVKHYTEKFEGKDVPRPPHWGGYIVTPLRYVFWQGRDSRLHDRICYTPTDSGWEMNRLAP